MSRELGRSSGGSRASASPSERSHEDAQAARGAWHDVSWNEVDAASFERTALRAGKARRGWLVRRALLAADVTGLLAAFAATEVLFRGRGIEGGVSTTLQSVIFVLTLPAWLVAAKLYGLYDRDEERATHSTADEVLNVFHLITVGVLAFYATSWLVGLTRPNQGKLSTFWLLALLGVIGARTIARTLVRRHPGYVQNTVIVGAGNVGQLIGRKLLQHPEYKINLVGL